MADKRESGVTFLVASDVISKLLIEQTHQNDKRLVWIFWQVVEIYGFRHLLVPSCTEREIENERGIYNADMSAIRFRIKATKIIAPGK
ncbi:hypothetical protein X736_10760 [Mesorhizobium sp. L2C089B000]|nr:hypothetical protein X736_10760 [Mesorhizobium sp. L2C089B000]